MKKSRRIFYCILFFTLIGLWKLPPFLYDQFGEMHLEQILFVILANNEGANFEIVFSYFSFIMPYLIISGIILLMAIYLYKHLNHKYLSKFTLNVQIRMFKKRFSRKMNIGISPGLISLILVICVFAISIKYDNSYQVVTYFKNQMNQGTLYEDYYVDPDTVEISFPEEKKNLIYIIVESFNTNFTSMEIDGNVVNLMPNLEQLAENNISFTNDRVVGALNQVRGTSWTMGSLVGQTGGIPLIGPISGNAHGSNGTFLPGLKTIGEVLETNGYSNYLSIGSNAAFAGRDTYFSTHGNYEIFDLNYWKTIGKIPDDYRVFWGMEDFKLFEYSKEKLLEISKNNEPFNFTLLTVDSHYTDGYTDEICPAPYETIYANAISCSDYLVNDFIEWIMSQDFYEDTTVVIVADHNTMNNEFLDNAQVEEKTLYNAFLNLDEGVMEDDDRTVYREISIFDMFPTTLASLNVTITGNRLGLGTNIFSEENTMLEEFGMEQFDNELALKSNYYMKNFHKNRDK